MHVPTGFSPVCLREGKESPGAHPERGSADSLRDLRQSHGKKHPSESPRKDQRGERSLKMKKIKILFLGILVMGIFILAALAPARMQGRFILPVGYCKVCLQQMDRA
jgi:hypothetical protein